MTHGANAHPAASAFFQAMAESFLTGPGGKSALAFPPTMAVAAGFVAGMMAGLEFSIEDAGVAKRLYEASDVHAPADHFKVWIDALNDKLP